MSKQKFTRSRPEIIKYINKEIRFYSKWINTRPDFAVIEAKRAIYILEEIKRFMTIKTDWLE